MPLGDSITAGRRGKGDVNAVFNGADYGQGGGYRIELFARAQAEGRHLTFVGSQANGPATAGGAPFPRAHEGHSGYTIDEQVVPGDAHASRHGLSPLLAPPVAVVVATHPDIITLLIGINDIQHNFDPVHAPNRVGALLDKIFAEDTHALVIVGTLLPTGADVAPDVGAPLNPLVDAFNAALGAVVAARAAAGKHVTLLDLHATFAANPAYASQLLGDNLHPTAAGYALLGDTWYAALRPLLH